MSMERYDLESLRKNECRFKDDDKYEWINCAFCKKEVCIDDLSYYDDNYDIGWCSTNCIAMHEIEGMDQWESQMEDA